MITKASSSLLADAARPPNAHRDSAAGDQRRDPIHQRGDEAAPPEEAYVLHRIGLGDGKERWDTGN